MRLLFTICGRAGSKGVKNKNLKSFLGAPLVYYTLAAINEYKKLLNEDDIIDVALSTDSEELINLVESQKSLTVFVVRRSEELSNDVVAKVAVIKDCFEHSKDYFNCEYDAVVDLDITSPLRTANDIKNVVDRKLEHPEFDAVYSVAPSRRNPYFNMVKENNGFSEIVIPSDFTARQQVPTTFDMNASIYAYSVNALLDKNSVGFFKSNCSYVVMKDTGILDIDNEEDFELIQIVADYIYKNYSEFRAISDEAKRLLTDVYTVIF